MSVPIAASRSSYVGNGVTTFFSTGFYFLDQADVVVKLTPSGGVQVVQTLGVHYTVTMPAGVGLNGSITMLVAPPNLGSLVVERTVPFVQDTSFRTSGSFSAARHEDATDEVVFQTQQLHRRVSDLESAGPVGSVIAGNGLVFSATTLHVGAGTGIQANADTVDVLYGASAELLAAASDALGPYTAGVLNKAARIDHQHQVFTFAPATLAVGQAAGQGVETRLARADHQHAVPVGAPVPVDAAAAVTGVSGQFSDASHKHSVNTAAAIDLTDAVNAAGAATTLARSDHTHAHGARGGGTLHAVATAAIAGFMPAALFAPLDGIKASKTHVRAWQSVLQAIANFTSTTVLFDTEDYDAAAEYNPATGIFTAAQDGYYMVTAGVGLAAAVWAAGNSMSITLLKNAVAESGGGDVFETAINRASTARFATGIQLTAGQTLKIVIIHNQGGPVNTTASRSASWLTIDRIL